MSITHGTGCKVNVPDKRDWTFSASPKVKAAPKPAIFSLVGKINLRFDQLNTNSCVGNGVSLSINYLKIKQGLKAFIPSRLFIYYNARKAIKETAIDEGCSIRDAIKSVNIEGACSEDTWKFDTKKVTTKPDTNSYKEALEHQTLEYRNIPRDIEEMKNCLYEGYPFVFGFKVPKSIHGSQTRKTGIVALPTASDPMDSGHAVLAVGWDDNRKLLICINSWGATWGDKGVLYLPYAYLTNSKWSHNFTALRLVEGEAEVKPDPKPEPKKCCCKCGGCPKCPTG